MATKKKQDGTLTKSAMARKMGLHHSAIGYAVKRGELVQTDEGRIDPSDERNEPFIRKHKTAIKASGVGGRGKPIITEDPDEVVGNSVEQGRLLDNQLKKVKIQKARIEYFEAIRRVYPHEVVARTLSLMRALLDENFKGFDDRFGDELHDIANSVDNREFGLALYKRIDESMRAVFAGLDKELEKYKPGKE